MPIKKPVANKAKAETKSNPVKKAAVEKKVAVKSAVKKVAPKAASPKKIVAKPAVKKAAPAQVAVKAASKPKVTVKKAAVSVVAKKAPAKKVEPKKTVAKVTVAKKAPVKKKETKQLEPVKAEAYKNETLKTKLAAEKKSVRKSAETLKQEKIEARKLSEIKVVVQTNVGNIELVLDWDKAPITVANFLKYISIKHYDGLIFHRVIPDFMIQGGGYEEEGLTLRATATAIKIESNNGLKNLRGTIAMARTPEPNSATSQFFINLVDNTFLDFKEKTIEGYGYTVFGKVVKGIEVVDRIGTSPTKKVLYHENLPTNPIRIETMKVIKSDV